MYQIISKLLKDEATHNTDSLRYMQAIQVGKYKLSVQASKGHYCHPRETMNINFYSSYEMAIITEQGNFLDIHKSSTIRKFPRYSELLGYYDGSIFVYLPTDLLNDLYLFLNQ